MGDCVIKVSRFIYIHFTTIFLFIIGYLNRTLEIISISYISVLLHEIAHLIAAILIGLLPSHIILFPFGVNLKLKNSLVYSLADEILLYLSGPFVNILLALLSIPFISYSRYWSVFYYNNIGLFIFNLLPILPMDGGVIIKKILSQKIGSRNAEKILKVISTLLIICLICFEGYLIVKNKFNFSALVAAVFLTGNIFTNKEKYYLDFTKELMYYKNKDKRKIKKVKTLLVKENGSYKDVAKHFCMGNSYIIFKENEKGTIKEILTEREIMEGLLNKQEYEV